MTLTHSDQMMLINITQEKEKALSADYGKDLASVLSLQRKHEGFEVRHKFQINMQDEDEGMK